MSNTNDDIINTKFYLCDVKGDGSCFYRALYNALKQTKLLYRFLMIFEDTDSHGISMDEEKFIKVCRSIIIDSIEREESLSSYYESFKDDFENDKETLDIKIRSTFTRTVFSFLSKVLDYEEDEFIDYETFKKLVVKRLKSNDTYASQLEVYFMKDFLEENCAIELKILYDINLKMFDLSKDIIYLVNQDEKHYKYIMYRNSMERKRKRPRTHRRKAKRDRRY